MKTENIIKLGESLGLSFNCANNYPSSLLEGRIVFDGVNGQRFSFDCKWSDKKIYKHMGESLILIGKRAKALEIDAVLSINNDHNINFTLIT